MLFSYAVVFVATEKDPAQMLIDFAHSIGDGFEQLGWASTANGWALTKCPGSTPNRCGHAASGLLWPPP